MQLPDNFFTPDYMFARLGKRKVYVHDLQPGDIRLRDIAHRLACINRWRGDAVHPWSVASHSLLCVQLAEQDGVTDRQLLAAVLMHDAHEAYTVDLPRDIKGRPGMADYRALANGVQTRIESRFGMGPAHAWYHSAVKKYDNAANEVEFKELIFDEFARVCTPVTWWTAEQAFLSKAGELGVRD